MDMTASLAPKSDPLHADDLMAGPVTVTIREVKAGSAEQPVDVVLVEFPGRAYRPSKSMRRVMVNAWGKEAGAYAGHRLTLYRNPEIKFGSEKTGGIEISHLSHIETALTLALTATRGKRKNFTVKPLPVVVVRTEADWLALAKAVTTVGGLTALFRQVQEAKGLTESLNAAFGEIGGALKAAEAEPEAAATGTPADEPEAADETVATEGAANADEPDAEPAATETEDEKYERVSAEEFAASQVNDA